MDNKTLLDLSLKYLKQDIKDFSLQDIKTLDDILKIHSDLYYNKENPIISDFEYDKLFKKLKILEEKNSILLDSTNRVGSSIGESSFVKVAHSRPMISLDNTYSSQDLYDFDARFKKLIGSKCDDIEYTLEYKFDGLGLELVYENGVFIQAITRGDGVYGEDVTQNAMQIANIPKKIDFLGRLEVRGEVVMPISVFNKLNEENLKTGEKIFSTPRNRASGSLRLLDNSITKKRNLEFYAYDLGDYELFKIGKYFDLIKTLEKLGFSISSYFKVFKNIDEIISQISYNNKLKSKTEFLKDNNSPDFDIDGLVIKVNDMSSWQIAGKTRHHPRYAIAYKFPTEIYTTKILSIEHSVGRTGTITPVANLEEVNIGGVSVKRATLHNYDEIKNLGVMIGDRVFIKRAGEVIPDIVGVIKEARVGDEKIIEVPTYCPFCNTKIEKDEDKVRYYCPNSIGCIAQISGKIIYAVGKSGLNIDGLGEKQVELFLKLGFITDLVSIFNLKNYKEDILKLEGYKQKSVNNLLNSIENSRIVKIDTFLSCLSIPGVGKKTSKLISRLFKNKDDILNFAISKEELLKIQGIGEETANSIIEYFLNNKEFLQRFLFEVDIVFDKNISKIGVFDGKKICITGSFDGYSRDDLIKILEDNSGEFISNVSKKTDFLLAGNNAGSKLKKAQDLGVNIISIGEFFEMIK